MQVVVVVVVLCGVWLPAAINIGSCVETVTDNWERSPASHQLLILQRRKRKIYLVLRYDRNWASSLDIYHTVCFSLLETNGTIP